VRSGHGDRPGGHLVGGQGAGLVRADHRRRTERLHRLQVADQRPASGHAGGAHGQRQGQRREQPLRDQGDDHPDREQEAGPQRGPEGEGHAEEDHPGADREATDGPHRPVQVQPQGRGAAGDLAGQPGDGAQPGPGPGGHDHHPAAPGGDVGAGEDQVGRLGRVRGRDLEGVHTSGDRFGLAGQGRVVDLEVIGGLHPAVDRHPVALGEQQDVAWDQLGRGDPPLAAIAQGRRLLREQRRQRPGGPLGPVLLHEAEGAIDQHHGDDRPAEQGHLADKGQHRRHPKQQREEVEQLGCELTWEAGPAGLGEPVRTGLRQPRGRLLVGQAGGVHAQLPQHDLGGKRGQPW
jgi:hypothetical protein